MKKAIVTMMVLAATVALALTTFAYARGEAGERAPERIRRMAATGEGVQGEARHERAREKLTGEWRDAIRAKKRQLCQEGATQEEIAEAIQTMLDEYGVTPPNGAGRQFQGRQEGEARHERAREKLTGEWRDAIRAKKRQLRQEGATQEEIAEAIQAMLDEYGVTPFNGAGRQFQGRQEGGRQRARDGEGK